MATALEYKVDEKTTALKKDLDNRASLIESHKQNVC